MFMEKFLAEKVVLRSGAAARVASASLVYAFCISIIDSNLCFNMSLGWIFLW